MYGAHRRNHGNGPPAYHHRHHQMQYGAPQSPEDQYRMWYRGEVRKLTFNSRPAIDALSMEARKQRDHNNWDGMGIITEEIQNAIYEAPPNAKLPLLYLVDSISKNVGEPYTDQLFPNIIPDVYIATYRQVDGVTKTKMDQLINLWRTGGANGGDLYPSGMREAVEHELLGLPPPGPPQLNQAYVLATLSEFLRLKQEEMATEGYTPLRGRTVNVLTQLKQVLNAGPVAPHELADMMDKIQGMQAGMDPNAVESRNGRPAMPPSNTNGPPQAFSNPVPPQPYGRVAPQPFNAAHHQAHPNAQAQYGQPQYPQRAHPNAGQQFYPGPAGIGSAPVPAAPIPTIAAPAPVVATAAPVAAQPPLNVAALLQTLNNSGVLSQSRTPEPAAAAPHKSSLESYEEMILALNMSVDMIDLSKLSLPLAHLPVRCKQCGMRFPEGENTLQAHMDWHFRRNRNERSTEGRGAHRRWLPRETEWVHENDEADPSSSPKKATTAIGATKLTDEQIAKLRLKWVPVPSDRVNAEVVCPIDKEKIRPQWSDEEEEWVYMNAVKVNGVVYHATCKAEQKLSGLAQRAIKQGRSVSRSPAPSGAGGSSNAGGVGGVGGAGGAVVQGASAVSPGTKRKSTADGEDESGSVSGATDTKRVKLEPTSETAAAQDSAEAATSAAVEETVEMVHSEIVEPVEDHSDDPWGTSCDTVSPHGTNDETAGETELENGLVVETEATDSQPIE